MLNMPPRPTVLLLQQFVRQGEVVYCRMICRCLLPFVRAYVHIYIRRLLASLHYDTNGLRNREWLPNIPSPTPSLDHPIPPVDHTS
jgi:hypothetical protein